MSEIRERLDRLESLVEQQRDTIEAQRERIDELGTNEDATSRPPGRRTEGRSTTPENADGARLSRRSALKAGGLLALLFGSVGTASADPQGQVGTSSDPLNALHTAALHGDGPISVANSLDFATAANLQDAGTDAITFDGSQNVTIPNGDLDVAGNSIVNAGIDSSQLPDDSVTVAGNTVSLGDSTDIDHEDLSNIGPDDHHGRPNAGNGLSDNGGSFDIEADSIGTDELDAPAVAGPNLIPNDGKLELDSTSISADSMKFEAEGPTVQNSNIMEFETSTTSSTILLNPDGAVNVDGNIRPAEEGSYDLGSNGEQWVDIYSTNGVVGTSDARLKRNVDDLSDGVDRLADVRPVSYEWKDSDDPETRLGFVAQELEAAVPEAVDRPDDEEGYLGVNYDMVVPVAVDAIQTQQERIEDLERENDCLRERTVELGSRLNHIETHLGIDTTADRQNVADD